MFDVLLGMVFPRACLACGAPKADPFCVACLRTFPWNRAACRRCAAPSRSERCGRCTRTPPNYASARTVGLYQGVARDALMRFKLGGERRAAASLAIEMARIAPSADAITFVPATRASVRARGFDPAASLAHAVARRLGATCAPLLRKVRPTRDSAGLGRAERKANLRGAFAPMPGVPGSVVLIDDIVTTGATAEECTAALITGGAETVHILAFARTP